VTPRERAPDLAPLAVLQQHLDDPEVSEIMVLHDGSVWTETPDGLAPTGRIGGDDVALCLELLARTTGRRLDLLSPVLDCALADGTRVCAVIEPVAHGGPILSVRRFRRSIIPLAAFGSPGTVADVARLVDERRNVLVSGATSTGKTSLLSSVSRLFGERERIVCAEDTAELRFVHPHVVRLQTRPAGVDGRGEVTLQHLVRASLRLRPDRLVVGEVRGAEAIDMLLALASGHRGCWSTVHARSAADAVGRIRSLVLRDAPQWSGAAVDDLVDNSVDAVVHLDRDTAGRRRITGILERDESRRLVTARPS